ncbi:rhodanese-like domain-containing protein [Solimonas flava]|uniref:rhodanese-like domain-containing protein n=1 Tax=Solimonas flava TaxID=415849 RepID=UPI00041391B5|nr:rhodanese-like domain-containing protein [Solimonas flava]
MADHSPGFLALVDSVRPHIREVPAAELLQTMAQHPQARLLDVREQSEFAAGHVRGAEWLGKGIIERDIEARVPDKDTPLFLYCGGGYRSALAADNIQKMGYRQVWSIDGGWRALKERVPIEP